MLAGTACDGRTEKDPTGNTSTGSGGARLMGLQYGRLVDIYAYRRVEVGIKDRLDPRNRHAVLVQRDVVVGPRVQNGDPFATDTASYRYLPYDRQAGRRGLLILWDDQNKDEKAAYDRALLNATNSLASVNDHAAFQPGNQLAPPMVPADAAIVLTFDSPLGLDSAFFRQVPTALQVLQLVGNPDVVSHGAAYRLLDTRIVSKENGRILIIDPEISGFEAVGRVPNPRGLPQSQNQTAANIRIAFPTSGIVSNQLKVATDAIQELNSVDVNGDDAVIRDFRSGSILDDFVGNLPDEDMPEIATRKTMGIMSVDVAKRMVVVNKRFANLILRPRLPFVDGPISTLDGRPLGPRAVPQGTAFQNGDTISQDIVSPVTGEVVRIQGEVLQNLDIPILEGHPNLGKGGAGPTAILILSTVSGTDSLGNPVVMEGSRLEPLGKACEAKVHYHDQVILPGNEDVGDAGRRDEFLRFTPAPPKLDANRNPLPPNKNIAPNVQVSVEFSKPMYLPSVKSDENVILANRTGDVWKYLANPKVATVATEPTIATDLRGDGMAINLNPPLGLLHKKGTAEDYYFHAAVAEQPATDRSGKKLLVSDTDKRLDAVTFRFSLDKAAEDNLVASIVRRFVSADEDGTSEQDIILDYFGQYQVLPALGAMFGSPTLRFTRVADSSTLPSILRGNMGECSVSMPPETLYHGPIMLVTPPNPPEGWVIEPLVPQGSRVQWTYREDDFQLSHRNPQDFELDVEQLYWAPFIARSPSLFTFDVFDRFSMTLGTAEKRPDTRVRVTNPPPPGVPRCSRDTAWSARNGLSTNFAGNYLDNSSRAVVVSRKIYMINPQKQFSAKSGVVMMGWPDFEKTYTWRDRRDVGWDSARGVAVGLGGSQAPNNTSTGDRTLDITSPWLPELDDKGAPIANNTALNFSSGYSNLQADDFKGKTTQDHHPIALPLLVDVKVWPDDKANGLAKGTNRFQLAGINAPQPSPEVGFYNAGIPWMRVQSSGGLDLKNNETFVNPETVGTAIGGWLQNGFFGRFNAPPGDGMTYWGQADFVRKKSVITAGYVDMLLPNKNEFTPPPGWSGSQFGKNGYPDLTSLGGAGMRAGEITILTTPSFQELPAGTSIKIDYRGSESFDKSDTVYKPIAKETAVNRGNLLSPDFAEEQFRYVGSKRIKALGMTNYVSKASLLVDPKTRVAPRFINWRFTFFNNAQVNPATVPFLEFFAVKYRLRSPK